MPSLKQFRNWLAGQPVPGLPDRGLDGAAGEFIEKAKYDVRVDGTDARLKFGKFEGLLLSQVVGQQGGKDYLMWLAKSDFPDELKRLARAYRFPHSDEAREVGIYRRPKKKRAKKRGKRKL